MKGRLTRRLVVLAAAIGFVAVIGTLAFAYFATPPTVIAGLLDHGRLGALPGGTDRVGNAQWSIGEVAYPYTVTAPEGSCKGIAELRWQAPFGGWALANFDWNCVLGHPALSSPT